MSSLGQKRECEARKISLGIREEIKIYENRNNCANSVVCLAGGLEARVFAYNEFVHTVSRCFQGVLLSPAEDLRRILSGHQEVVQACGATAHYFSDKPLADEMELVWFADGCRLLIHFYKGQVFATRIK